MLIKLVPVKSIPSPRYYFWHFEIDWGGMRPYYSSNRKCEVTTLEEAKQEAYSKAYERFIGEKQDIPPNHADITIVVCEHAYLKGSIIGPTIAIYHKKLFDNNSDWELHWKNRNSRYNDAG